jgi:hypothetical protein
VKSYNSCGMRTLHQKWLRMEIRSRPELKTEPASVSEHRSPDKGDPKWLRIEKS